MDSVRLYERALDGLGAMLADVAADEWDMPSECSAWTVRDVTGHLVWGQEQLRHWALGQEYPDRDGAPGASKPGVLASTDPVATWRAARQRTTGALTDEALRRTVALPGVGEVPLTGILTMLMTDNLVHTWDIGHALGRAVRLDPELVSVAFDWARQRVVRAPGFFDAELTPPSGADEPVRMLAFLGRKAR